MFGIGIWEFVAIMFVVIVFINPKDLPKTMYKLAKLYRKGWEYHHKILKMINSAEEELKYSLNIHDSMLEHDTKSVIKTKSVIETEKKESN